MQSKSSRLFGNDDLQIFFDKGRGYRIKRIMEEFVAHVAGARKGE
jgi:hypothetical protein